jgi:hypothetical protein
MPEALVTLVRGRHHRLQNGLHVADEQDPMVADKERAR